MLKRVFCLLFLLLCLAGSALAAEGKNPTLLIETSLGNIKVELFQKEAPVSTRNFLE